MGLPDSLVCKSMDTSEYNHSFEDYGKFSKVEIDRAIKNGVKFDKEDFDNTFLGAVFIIHNLKNRIDLNKNIGIVDSFDNARVRLILVNSKESIKIK